MGSHCVLFQLLARLLHIDRVWGDGNPDASRGDSAEDAINVQYCTGGCDDAGGKTLSCRGDAV